MMLDLSPGSKWTLSVLYCVILLPQTARCKQLVVLSPSQRVDFNQLWSDTDIEMQAIVKNGPLNLTHLKRGESGVLDRLELPEDDARRLMELGFVPGHTVTSAHQAPGGDPRVFRVDGSEVALRRETAQHLILRS